MNTALKALSVIALSALTAGGVAYLSNNCPKKSAKLQETINTQIAQYIEKNPHIILEKIAKSENFGNTIKSFSTSSEEEVANIVTSYIQKNPELLGEYIRNNASHIASSILETEEFKNYAPSNTQTSNEEATTESQNDENKIYRDNWEKLSQNDITPYIGPKDAKVTVVEFFDFACGHCKSLAPVIAELAKNNPDVKFVFQPLYFMSDHSNYASRVSFAAFQKGKFLEVFEGVMTLPNLTEEDINQILVDEGLNVDEIKTMTEEKTIRRGVQDVDALSQVLGINGVPMLIINGEPFYGRSYQDLQNKINSLK
ncbi:MAG: thioredoxin domain-containing protein [Alphaproteobacteria bacterium]|nr:thioredoxin domain-containing protein [Alphaproteobacteria bacterium]